VDVTSSSSEDEGGRVVQSAKQRALSQFDKLGSAIKLASSSGNHVSLMEGYENLMKAVGKNKVTGGIPRSVVKNMCDVEDLVTVALADKASFRKLAPKQGRALNRLKLALRKNAKTFGPIMKEYRANPIVDEEDVPDVKKVMTTMTTAARTAIQVEAVILKAAKVATATMTEATVILPSLGPPRLPAPRRMTIPLLQVQLVS